MEVRPGIYLVLAPPQTRAGGVFPPNVYLVVGKRAAFIDSGFHHPEDVEARIQYWINLGRPEVAAIVLTHRHPDHRGGAATLSQTTGAPVISHVAEREAIQEAGVGVNQAVEEGQFLDLEGLTLEFIHAPGHTLGSMCIFVPERGVLFTGDTILGMGTTVISPTDGDMGLYMESLRKLLDYPAEVIGPGHGPPVRHPQAKIRELLAHRRQREDQILGLLQQGPKTLDDLLRAIYPELVSHLQAMARDQLTAHLKKLQREGRVASREGGSYYELS